MCYEYNNEIKLSRSWELKRCNNIYLFVRGKDACLRITWIVEGFFRLTILVGYIFSYNLDLIWIIIKIWLFYSSAYINLLFWLFISISLVIPNSPHQQIFSIMHSKLDSTGRRLRSHHLDWRHCVKKKSDPRPFFTLRLRQYMKKFEAQPQRGTLHRSMGWEATLELVLIDGFASSNVPNAKSRGDASAWGLFKCGVAIACSIQDGQQHSTSPVYTGLYSYYTMRQ